MSLAAPLSSFILVGLEFGVLVFEVGGKQENLQKKFSEQGENQQQTQPICDTFKLDSQSDS